MHNKPAGSSQNNHYDLLVIPQARTIMPAPHLSPDEAKAAEHAWHRFGNTSNTTFEQTWKVAIAHIKDDGPHITSQLTIPSPLD